jgi:hypothetical protein
LANGHTGIISEADIQPVDALADIETLLSRELTEIGRRNFPKTVIVKLNGGLGTSFKYAFVSNSDNLGAVLEPSIPHHPSGLRKGR